MPDERYRDFDAARAERASEPLVFRLRGEEFKCAPALPVGALIDNVRDDGNRAIVKTAQFIRDVFLDPGQVERFDDLLYDKADPVEPKELDAIGTWLLEVYMGRPLGQPSSSPTTSRPPGAASSPSSPSEGTPSP